jgi:hypothetical protein
MGRDRVEMVHPVQTRQPRAGLQSAEKLFSDPLRDTRVR